MAITISSGYYANPVYNSLVPAEGPKTIPIALDFAVATSYLVDLRDLVEQGVIYCVQTLFIDNQFNADNTIVTCNEGSLQQINAKGQTQGYYAVLASKIPRFTVTSAGGVLVPMQFINVPLPGVVWTIA